MSKRKSTSIQLANSGQFDSNRIGALLDPGINLQEIDRKVAYPDKDPFGLLEINDTYERALGRTFGQAINLVENLAHTQLTRTQRKKWDRGTPITLPERGLGEFYRYEMTVQKPTTESPSGMVHFVRTDEQSLEAERGFVICKTADGHMVLKDPRRGDVDIAKDEDYADLIVRATGWIHDYAGQFGLKPEALLNPPLHITRRQQAAEKIKNILPLNPNVKKRLRRVVAGAAVVGSVALAGTSGYSAFRDHQQHEAESKKQKQVLLESYRLNLAEQVHFGEAKAVAYMPYIPNSIIENASTLAMAGEDSDSDKIDRGVNGIFKLTDIYDPGLQINGYDPDERPNGVALSPAGTGGSCATMEAKLGPDTTVRAATTESIHKGELSVALDRNTVKICNTTDEKLYGDISDIYLEVKKNSK